MSTESESSLSISAHHFLGCVNEKKEFDQKLEELRKILADNVKGYDTRDSKDRTIILCRNDKVAVQLSTALWGEGKEPANFIREVTRNNADFTREWCELNNGVKLIGVCNLELFSDCKLACAKHYVFFDFPYRLEKMEKMFMKINKQAEQRKIVSKINFFTTDQDLPDSMRSLAMEISKYGAEIPTWLWEKIKNTPFESDIKKRLNDSLQSVDSGFSFTSTSSSSGSSPNTSGPIRNGSATSSTKTSGPYQRRLRRRRAVPCLDIHSIPLNPEGKYVIPSQFLGSERDNSDDSDDDEEAYYNYRSPLSSNLAEYF